MSAVLQESDGMMNGFKKLQVPVFLLLNLVSPVTSQADTASSINLERADDGGFWSFKDGLGKTSLFFLVDPDDPDKLAALRDRLKQKNFSPALFHTFAVIDLEATWKPNILIKSRVAAEQKKNPITTFLFDSESKLRRIFDLKEGRTHYLLFSASNSKIAFWQDPLDDKQIDEIIKKIEDAMSAT